MEQLIQEFLNLSKEKEDLKTKTEANSHRLEQIKRILFLQMMARGMNSVRQADGSLVYLTCTVRASMKDDVAFKTFCKSQVLEEGKPETLYDALWYETIPSQTLSKYAREVLASDKELHPSISPYFDSTVRSRKSTKKSDKSAKDPCTEPITNFGGDS